MNFQEESLKKCLKEFQQYLGIPPKINDQSKEKKIFEVCLGKISQECLEKMLRGFRKYWLQKMLGEIPESIIRKSSDKIWKKKWRKNLKESFVKFLIEKGKEKFWNQCKSMQNS